MPPAAGQATLFPDLKRFPQTRYQGSKRKLAGAIVHQVSGLSFTTVLDAFGGTGAVSHAFKCEGKHVTYNDILSFNHQIGTALIENDTTRLTDEDIAAVGARHSGVSYDDFIARMFDGIYFTPEENGWLDVAVANIGRIPNRFKRSLAWFALCQAAMAKRPYNLFHRRNLYMRTADVPRGFGNKSSWDRSFPDHFRRFAHEANGAVVDGQGRCRAICGDAMDVEPGYDLVYVDPPYVNANGVGVDYRDFYHFLEGMLHYDRWSAMIDLQSKHRRVRRRRNSWCDAASCQGMFRRLFDRFRDSILVVSYRSDGIPTVDELATMLREVKKDVEIISLERYQYALSTRRSTREVLLLATR